MTAFGRAFGGDSCPCGSGTPYDACCGPLHRGESVAQSAEQLMRSRYAAYARGDEGYLFATWHPRTRPASLALGDGTVWEGLEVLATRGGQADDDRGVVEFRAAYREDGSTGVLHEVSRFARRAGRWVYVDGDVS